MGRLLGPWTASRAANLAGRKRDQLSLLTCGQGPRKLRAAAPAARRFRWWRCPL